MRLALLHLSFLLSNPPSRGFFYNRLFSGPSRGSLVNYSMASNNDDEPTQGSKLTDFYGAATATMYAGMMEEEMAKYKDDFSYICDMLRKEFVKDASDNPVHIRVLDTCCGSCHMLQYIDQNLASDHAEIELMGIDLSPEMIKVGRTIAPQAKLKVGNMLNLSTESSESYHLILNNFAMHHATPDQAKDSIQEYSQLLVPGGLLFFSAWEGTGKIDYG